jgi:integrase/recombinase XerC
MHRYDVLTAWYKEFITVKGFRPRSVKAYLFELSFFRRYLADHTDIADIDHLSADHLRAYTTYLYDRNNTPRTIANKITALKSFFATLYAEHKIYLDHTSHLVQPRIGKSLPTNILTESEAGVLFEYLETRATAFAAHTREQARILRDRAVLEVLYGTGARLSELLALRLGDITYDEGLIAIRDGKGGKDRVVPIGDKGLESLATYVRSGRRYFAGHKSGDRLFLNRFGAPLGSEGLRYILDTTLKAAGIEKHLRVHDLRHTCATHMLNHGADIRFVQELLGHASLSSTQVYTHVSIAKLKESHRKFHPRESGEFEQGNA